MAKTPELNLEKLYQRNYLINGNFDLWQRNTTFSGVSTEVYTADRWRVGRTSGSATSNTTRSTDVPSGTSANFSINIAVATAQPSFGASDRYGFLQRVEGFNFRPLKNSTATLSFWVKGSTVGTYSVGFYNAASDRAWTSTYTINSANTWEKKTVKVNFKAATGTWDFSTGLGVGVYFTLASGASVQTSTLNSWVNTATVTAASQVNMMATAGNYIRFAQVQLVEGDEDIPFRLAGQNIANETLLCQRYFEKSYDLDTVPGSITDSGALYSVPPTASSGGCIFQAPQKALKRVANPAVTIYNPLTGATGSINRAGTPISGGVLYLGQSNIYITNSVVTLADNGHQVHFTIDAEL